MEGQGKVLQLITIDIGGGGGEISHCKNVCRLMVCKIWSIKEASIGKDMVILMLHVIHKLFLQYSHKVPINNSFERSNVKNIKILRRRGSVQMVSIDYIGRGGGRKKPEK